MKRRNSYFLILIPLIILLAIFHNSMYSLNESDLQSGFILNAFNRFFASKGYNIVFTQFLVRKLAHFTEYFFFGLLLTFAVWAVRRNMGGTLFYELFLFLVIPVIDETIQLLYKGRGSSVRDVLIDFAGCVTGMGICRLILRIFRLNKNNIQSAYIKTAGTAVNCSGRRAFTVLTVVFILFIFHNSIFSGPQSSTQSRYVMDSVNNVLTFLHVPVLISEHLVRKTAHFIEYFVLGLLMTITIKLYSRPVKKTVPAELFFLMLVPVTDEFIQFFRPGRGSSVTDVLLDFSGGIAGMVFCCLIKK